MPKFLCRQCGFSTGVPAKTARFGMMCPECHGGNMKVADGRRRRGGRDLSIRPGSIRLVIGGAMCVVIGGALPVWGRENWNAGKLGAKFVGAGIAMIGGGLICLAVGGYGIIRALGT